MDFGLVHLRPIRRDDSAGLIEFHEGLSRDTQYFRFFTAHPHLSAAEVQRFTRVDYKGRLALVAELDGKLIAVARYDRLADSARAEVAFVVADAFQCHGLGGALLRRLAEAAAQRGIEYFVAETLAENRRMQSVFRESGFDVHAGLDGNVVGIDFPIVSSRT